MTWAFKKSKANGDVGYLDSPLWCIFSGDIIVFFKYRYLLLVYLDSGKPSKDGERGDECDERERGGSDWRERGGGGWEKKKKELSLSLSISGADEDR